jgi:eukaryotic-like serine/threonine-protein kinase
VVLEPLGYGAMGIVYRAFDPELDRRIAVKLLRRVPAFASREQERFLREGKAMARLSHPNVVNVYDVGTHGERVFVAMELVDGETLRSWLKSRPSWGETVAMFVQAGRGLAAAHAAGIVHRDFKPDNALVGADGRVRVVDFGLAWTPEAPPPGEIEVASHTHPSSGGSWSQDVGTLPGSMVGTPRYSPPEQIEGQRVDARADQFAFCASLWEALYGDPPFQGDDLLTLVANMRGGKLERRPAHGGLPGRLTEALRRGLSAEPEERFPSMDGLLDVLERDPAVVRRRWLGVSSAVAIALAGIGLVVSARVHDRGLVCRGAEQKFAGVWDPERKISVGRALQASGKAWAGETTDLVAAELDRYGRAWSDMRHEACEATSIRHEQSEAMLDLRMQCLDERLDEVRSLVTLLSQADETLLDAAPKAVYAITPVRGCADTRALLAPVPLPRGSTPRAEFDQVRMGLTEVKAMNDVGRYAEAGQRAADLTARATGLRYAPMEAEALEVQGDSLEDLAEYPRAADTYRAALWAAERGLDRGRAASVMINLVWVMGVDQGLHEQAHEYAGQAAAVLTGLGGDIELEANLASHEGAVFRDEGRLEEAEKRGREAIEKRRLAFGPMHPRYAMALNNVAAYVADQGRYAEALALSQEALTINAHTLGEHHPDYGLSLQSVAGSLNLLGRHLEARTLGEQALAVLEEAFGLEHARVASAEWSLALIDTDLGEYAEAEQHLRHAVAVAENLRGGDHVYVAEYLSALGDALAKEGRNAEAVLLYRRALAILAKDDNGPVTAEAQSGLGLALLGLGRPAEALTVLDAALSWQEKNEHQTREVARTRLRVSRALSAKGQDGERARRLAALAVEAYAADPGAKDDLREATAWLDGLPAGTARRALRP